jgi:hypothetical protein
LTWQAGRRFGDGFRFQFFNSQLRAAGVTWNRCKNNDASQLPGFEDAAKWILQRENEKDNNSTKFEMNLNWLCPLQKQMAKNIFGFLKKRLAPQAL